jgi:hypothetical protein
MGRHFASRNDRIPNAISLSATGTLNMFACLGFVGRGIACIVIGAIAAAAVTVGRNGAHGLIPDARIRAFVFLSQLRPTSVCLRARVPGRRKQARCRHSIPVARQRRQANAEDHITEVDRMRFLCTRSPAHGDRLR